VPIVLKYGSLNLLEPSGPVEACTWIALPLTHNSVKQKVKKTLINDNWPLFLDLKPGAPEHKTGLPAIRQ
jgi:hypothetical protein